MQEIILSHSSALIVNRQMRINNGTIPFLKYVESLINSKEKYGTNFIEVMVDTKIRAHNNWRFKYRVCSASLPKNSIYKITDNIFCVSPELLVIQLSNLLSVEKLALIVLEMCGTYSINPINKNFERKLPLQITTESLKAYIKKYEKLNPGFHGVNNLKKICKFINNGAASPMESRLYIRLCGNRKNGYYGCTGLEMNKSVKLSKEAAKIAGQNIVIVDILCKRLKVAIEYNSAEYHENSAQGQKDSRRRDALVFDGWEVFSITPQQYYNEETFHIIALQILKALNQNYRFKISNFTKLRHDALESLN